MNRNEKCTKLLKKQQFCANRKTFPISVDKYAHWVYNDYRKKARPQTVMPLNDYILRQPTLAEGGYCAFMGNSIVKTITTKIAISSFFAISTMLTFHKHTPFRRLGIAACESKSRGHNRR